MSHLVNKVLDQSPDRLGHTSISLENISSFTASNENYLGANASGELTQSVFPSTQHAWHPVYHWIGKEASWGGGSTVANDPQLWWRKGVSANSTLSEKRDSQYATPYVNGSSAVNQTWANQVLLTSGTYLLNASFIATVASNSDMVALQLENITDSTFHGNISYWGASQTSNAMYAYVTINANKIFQWSVTSITGNPNFINSSGMSGIHINIWRL